MSAEELKKQFGDKVVVVESAEDLENVYKSVIAKHEAEEAAKSEARKWFEALIKPYLLIAYILFAVAMSIVFAIGGYAEQCEIEEPPFVDPEVQNLSGLSGQN